MKSSHRCVCLALSLALAGCGGTAPKGGAEAPPSAVKLARQVTVAKVEQRDLAYVVDTVGTLEPIRQTNIAAGVTGIVDEVLFREGDVVKAGETVLARIDQPKYRAAAELAVANENRAMARLQLLEDLLRRNTGLRRQGALSEVEQVQAQMDVQMAKAELASAAAAKRLAEITLDKSRVRAPYAGQLNSRKIAVGDYVKEETVLATIADLSQLRVTTYVPELAAPRVRIGDRFTFTLEALPGREYRAKIVFLSTVADPQTHMFECKAEIDEPDAAMRPGLFARVKIATDKRTGACVAPEESVRPSENGFVIFVPKNVAKSGGGSQLVAEARTVQIGFRRPGFIELLGYRRPGSSAMVKFEPGEPVVAKGAEALVDGVPLEIVDADGRPASAAPSSAPTVVPSVAAESSAPGGAGGAPKSSP
ncbi:MAG TPA: efflux RND transporter periplasmic adaptor subunit [Planctomycetia bacterium]|nr:efflux RND transporter periplasmic adaptor subunit [Planctomycetia bacterium]